MIAVRKAVPNTRYSFEWAKKREESWFPRIISGSAFLPTIYKMFSWKQDSQYKMLGQIHKCGEESVLIFSAEEALLAVEKKELFIEGDDEDEEKVAKGKKKRKIIAYPKEWADSFGENYYERCAKEEAEINKETTVGNEQITYSSVSDNVTSPQQAAQEIKNLIEEMGVEDE